MKSPFPDFAEYSGQISDWRRFMLSLTVAGTVVFPMPAFSQVVSASRPVALISTVCLQSDLSIDGVRLATVNALEVPRDQIVKETTSTGGLYRAAFSVSADPEKPDSKVRLSGELRVSYLDSMPGLASSCSLSFQGEINGVEAGVLKFSKALDTFTANFKPTEWRKHPEAAHTFNNWGVQGKFVYNGKPLLFDLLVEKSETPNERLTAIITVPPKL